MWGGLYQDQAGLSTRESMKQVFSYLANCGLRTKNMNAAGDMSSTPLFYYTTVYSFVVHMCIDAMFFSSKGHLCSSPHFSPLPAHIDTLTEHTAFWNGRKIENLAISLGMQYEKVSLYLLTFYFLSSKIMCTYHDYVL